MNILIIGSGGREHALAWKVKQSKNVSNVFISPGNYGTDQTGTNLDIDISQPEEMKQAVIENEIDLVIIGPEDPLVNGIYDIFKKDPELQKVHFIGPDKYAAQLEGSKEFAKQFMNKYNIPTARYKSFTNEQLEEGYKFLEELNPPYVLKADGLAAGKGVSIIKEIEKAKNELAQMLQGKFGRASKKVVIEEFLDGIELSVFVLTDGKNYLVLPEAKDYKRVGEGDTGLNTGGMGAVSPVPFADKAFMKKIEEQIIIPTIKGIENEKMDYRGFIFFGLINVKNNPYVIEYNVRMGDPETEVVLPRIDSDFLELLVACSEKKLDTLEIKIKPQTCATVVLASKGYPEAYEKGKKITIGDQIPEVFIFHSATKFVDNQPTTNGGRVMAISAFGNTKTDALKKSYEMINQIKFEGMFYRNDIGFDL